MNRLIFERAVAAQNADLLTAGAGVDADDLSSACWVRPMADRHLHRDRVRVITAHAIHTGLSR